ncbi:MAG TPA: DUF559 domain-containing protein [Roseiflexaceae bacterium]|nr:DUF559 domain-containing protein [Roseiflexaceae bacterium]
MTTDHCKDPNKVKGGQARQRQLREQLGEQGYREQQKSYYTTTLAKHPQFHATGACAANAAQLAAWGAEGYISQRKNAYRVCQEKYGAEFARMVVQTAHEARRLYRLDHPTPGEAALRALLSRLGFRVHLPQTRFDYANWLLDPWSWALDLHDALAEGCVGPYACDILLPVRRIAIEVEGGVHALTRERDTRRRAFLEAQGLQVLVLSEATALDRAAARCQLLAVLGACQPTLFHSDY